MRYCLITKKYKPISYKWIFKIERNSKGHVKMYKVHLIVRSFTQKERIDSKEMFSPFSLKDSFKIIWH